MVKSLYRLRKYSLSKSRLPPLFRPHTPALSDPTVFRRRNVLALSQSCANR